MTNNTENPYSGSADLASFLTGGYRYDCPTASTGRYMALSEAVAQQRFDEALEVLLDDGVDLYDDLGADGPAGVPETSWMHTVMGRRTAEMLIRLDLAYRCLVGAGELEAAWAVIEMSIGFVAVAAWLQDIQAGTDDELDIENGGDEEAA
jgi:hypothetical protein